MLKSILAAFVLVLAPRILWCEPIEYIASFIAAGTLTESDGTVIPFDGKVFLSLNSDTTRVIRVFEDGEFEGYETRAPLTITVEGLGAMKSLIEIEAYSVRGSLELDGYKGDILLPTFVFSYAGFYNLETPFHSTGSWTINYFNMGSIPTTKGKLQFTDAISDGRFIGLLQD